MIKGAKANQILEEIRQRNSEISARWLAEAKTEAEQRGKELFDFEQLTALCDTSHRTPEGFETMYYVENPDVMTLAELAKMIDKSNFWDYGH